MEIIRFSGPSSSTALAMSLLLAEKLQGLLNSLDMKSALPEITSLDDAGIITAIEDAYEIRGIEDLHMDYVQNWTRIVTLQ